MHGDLTPTGYNVTRSTWFCDPHNIAFCSWNGWQPPF